MFSWWSSLGPEEATRREKSSEKPSEGGNKTEPDVNSSQDGEDSIKYKETSEIDYAKDIAKNVGSKYIRFSCCCFFFCFIALLNNKEPFLKLA